MTGIAVAVVVPVLLLSIAQSGLPPERRRPRPVGRRAVAARPHPHRGGRPARRAVPGRTDNSVRHLRRRRGQRRPGTLGLATTLTSQAGSGTPGIPRSCSSSARCCSRSARSASGSSSSCGRPRCTWRCCSCRSGWPASAGQPSRTGPAGSSTRSPPRPLEVRRRRHPEPRRRRRWLGDPERVLRHPRRRRAAPAGRLQPVRAAPVDPGDRSRRGRPARGARQRSARRSARCPATRRRTRCGSPAARLHAGRPRNGEVRRSTLPGG